MLTGDADLALFRALQESLSNVTQHAGGRVVQVELEVVSSEVIVTIRDDGRGFSLTHDGRVHEGVGRMGLTGMRERLLAVGGTVALRNAASGAEVRLSLPVLREAIA